VGKYTRKCPDNMREMCGDISEKIYRQCPRKCVGKYTENVREISRQYAGYVWGDIQTMSEEMCGEISRQYAGNIVEQMFVHIGAHGVVSILQHPCGAHMDAGIMVA